MATIQKRGDSYSIRVSCGYDSKGKQVIQSMTWKPEPKMTAKQIEKELNRQATLFEEKVKTGQFINSNIKFAEFAKKWFCEYAEKQLKPKTTKPLLYRRSKKRNIRHALRQKRNKSPTLKI